MKSLLEEVQAHLREYNEDGVLEDYQIPLIPTTKTFIQFAAEVDNGLSSVLGLIKYCDNAVTVVKGGVDKNKINVPIVIHIGEKMAHTGLAIRDVINLDTLDDDEKRALSECEEKCAAWLNHPQRNSLLNDVDARVNIAKLRMADAGVLHTIRNQNTVLEPLLTWA